MKTITGSILISIALLFTVQSSKAQVFSSLEQPFSYFAGVEVPDADWFLAEYDDTGWDSDTGTIGYGYYHDGLPAEDIQISPAASSLYLRFHFQVDDKSAYGKASFFADYDDGYIAYLNGNEILRVNIDPEVEHPAYNDLATRSHAMQTYGWNPEPVETYYLDSLQLDSCLVNGDNVLAIQVLNDSVGGSDLQFLCRFYNITNYDYNFYNERCRYKRQYTPDSTSFPIVVIETDEYGIPVSHIRRTAFMGIIDNGEGNYNKPTDSCNIYYGNASMEVRGESSKDFPKQSYRFELQDQYAVDSNVSLLGMPADDDWILLGPFHDKALFRNPMVFDMGRNLNGSYQPRSRFCEVYLNGEFIGLYSLLETIKRNKDRVNIARLRPEEISGNDLTGGYILRFDKPSGSLQIVYPKPDNISQEQIDYIMGYYDEYSSVVRTSYFMDPEIGFRKYLNDTSLIDYLIVNEITKNADSYLFSSYFYKDRDDRDPRFHWGPLWDMNLAFGNVWDNFQGGARYDEWQFDNSANSNNRTKAKKLFQDTAFVHLFQERWWAARNGIFSTDSIMHYIDSMAIYLKDARIRNYEVWPVIDEDIFYPNYHSQTYEEEIQNMKDWIVNRLDWIDDNINDIFYEVVIPNEIPQPGEEISFSYEAYPNPFSDKLIIALSSPQVCELQVQIYDLVGTLKYVNQYEIQAGNSSLEMDDYALNEMSKGIYLLRITIDGIPFATQRVVKQ